MARCIVNDNPNYFFTRCAKFNWQPSRSAHWVMLMLAVNVIYQKNEFQEWIVSVMSRSKKHKKILKKYFIRKML